MYQLPLLKPDVTWFPPDVLPSLKGHKRIALDIETKDVHLSERGPGFIRGDAHVVGIALGTEHSRQYFPIRHEDGANLDPKRTLDWAREELGNFDGEVVGARLIYDLEGLASDGIHMPRVKRFYDIQNAEPLLDENRLEYGLDALSKDYLGEGKQETLLREAAIAYGFAKNSRTIKQNLHRMPAEYVGPYAEADVDRPLRILPLQWAKMEAQGLLPLFDLESRLIPLLLAMKRRGVPVDVNRAMEVRSRLVVERQKHLAEARRLLGPKVELMAPESFAQALIERGIPVPMTPKSKQPSINKFFLAKHMSDPAVAAIAAGRRVNTIITTFIDGHISHAVKGRIHCEFNQLKGDDDAGGTKGTIARFSSSNPNLQNVPARDEELAELIRGLFVPEPGETWERKDYSQIEYRLLSHYAMGKGAAECRRMYREDPKTDYHAMCAVMCGVDPTDKIKRKRVKNVNFGKVYGSGIDTIAATMGCTREYAVEFVRDYDSRLPFVKTTFEAVMKRAETRGYVFTILGRLAHFDMWEPRDNYDHSKGAYPREVALKMYGPAIKRAWTYAALNRVLQGGAADMMKKAMVDIWESGICDEIGVPLLTVHDELNDSIPPTQAGQEAARESRRLMERAIELRVPVVVDVERGASWGTCH